MPSILSAHDVQIHCQLTLRSASLSRDQQVTSTINQTTYFGGLSSFVGSFTIVLAPADDDIIAALYSLFLSKLLKVSLE